MISSRVSRRAQSDCAHLLPRSRYHARLLVTAPSEDGRSGTGGGRQACAVLCLCRYGRKADGIGSCQVRCQALLSSVWLLVACKCRCMWLAMCRSVSVQRRQTEEGVQKNTRCRIMFCERFVRFVHMKQKQRSLNWGCTKLAESLSNCPALTIPFPLDFSHSRAAEKSNHKIGEKMGFTGPTFPLSCCPKLNCPTDRWVTKISPHVVVVFVIVVGVCTLRSSSRHTANTTIPSTFTSQALFRCGSRVKFWSKTCC